MLQFWGTREGLPQNTIAAMVQTRDGYLWLGTQEGLVRFDGVRFTVFDRGKTPELGHNTIWRLHEGRSGRLYVGTVGGGLSVLERSRFRRYSDADGLPSDQVSAILEDRSGRLWVGTSGRGLVRLAGDVFARDPQTAELPGRFVSALAEDQSGRLWIGSEAGLSVLAEGRLRTFTAKDGLAQDSVTALLAAKSGGLWIGTESGGVSHRSPAGHFSSLTTRDGLGSDRILSLLEDEQGALWIGTEGGGLGRLLAGRVDMLTARDGLGNGHVRALLQDREGSLWLGLTGAGLARLRGGPFRSLSTSDGLASNRVLTIFEDRDGAVWIGGESGLDRLKDGRVARAAAAAGMPVFSLHQTRDGSLWIGTNGRGLLRLRDGRVETYTTRDGLVNDVVESLQEDRDGVLWVGTRRGLSRFEGGRFTPVGELGAAASAGIPTLLEDSAGALWIGTHGEGLIRVREGRAQAFTARDGLSSLTITGLHEDRAGSLWIATYGGGVQRFKNGRIAAITTAAGLADDGLMQVLEDDQGFLWFTSNRRIFRVARRELDAVADGAAERVTSQVFSVADGMKSSDCNGGSQPAGWRSRDGRLWFPTQHGAAVVDPARIASSSVFPPVSIEEVLIDQRRVPAGASVEVPPGANSVEIHYTAPSFVAPSKVLFKYQLVGFDEGWVDAGSRRVAYYTRVGPGGYSFRVLASSDAGVWNEKGATLGLAVVPRFHETRWFRLLFGLLAIGALAAAYRARVWRLRARERELVAVVDERTRGLRDALGEAEAQRARAEEANRAKSVFLAAMSHELRTPLNVVLGYAQLMDRAQERTPEDRQHLQRIRKSGQHLLGLIDDVLSLSRIETGQIALQEAPFDLPGLLRDVEEMLRERAQAGGLDFRVEAGGLPPSVSGDAVRLRQILINLLANAVKFTERGAVVLRASWSSGRGRFEVEDTGSGIAPHELASLFQKFVQTESGRRSGQGTGLGLALSRELARAMGGDIVVDSAVGRGSRFRLDVALPLAAAEGAAATGDGRRVRRLAPGQPEWRVLVADDVADNRLLLAQLLAAVGFSVRQASSGEEALSLWRAWQPHLVWMDVRMPGGGGLAATRAIREEERRSGRARTAILALSASALEQEREEGLAAGCDEFVSKPVREALLLERTAARLGAAYVFEDGPPAARPPAGARRFAAGQSVLVVDDQRANREVARALLSQMGVSSLEAGDGREALARLRSESASAVLLDIEMPGMDGLETLRQIRSSESLRRIPVLALTAHAGLGDEQRFFEAGADAYLPKPIDVDLLGDVLARWLRPAPSAAGAPDLPGIDVAFGVQQAGGDAALHRELVGSLVSDLAGLEQRVAGALANGDAAAAIRLVHSVRGVAACVGARRLAAAAGELEEQLRRGGDRPGLEPLAAAAAEVRGEAAAAEPPRPAGRPRVLVADDQSATSAVIARALSDRCDVALAASAAEALALAGEGIDLAILDVMLPDLDGFELCRRLKADERTRDVPVVFVTALEEAADETRGFAAGGADYITKPISPPVLRARVETQLELKRARDRLLQLASIDALTGVGNRRRFESVLHEEWQRAKRARCWLSLAMVDVDHFKRFNDRYGHARGDECLRLVARALAAACRRPADQIARYGGEEFALVLPDTDPLGARYALENALRAVRELRLEHAGSPLAAYLTVSIGGVSVMPAAAGEASDAMEAADRLLFEAKAAGRNRALHCDLASGASTCVPGESR